MAVEALFRRTLRGLEPANPEASEVLKLWKLGAHIKGVFKVTRSNARNDWYWKLCEIVHENSDRFGSKDEVSDTIKLGCGVVKTVQRYEHGEWTIERSPGSVAFRNMDEPTFRAFTIRAQAFVCSMLGCESEQLAEALEDYLNPDSRRAA
jgi:hypothetical protein